MPSSDEEWRKIEITSSDEEWRKIEHEYGNTEIETLIEHFGPNKRSERFKLIPGQKFLNKIETHIQEVVVLDDLDPVCVYTFICVEIKTNTETVVFRVFHEVQTTLLIFVVEKD